MRDYLYLSDRLPHPYTDESAEWWINMVAKNDGRIEGCSLHRAYWR